MTLWEGASTTAEEEEMPSHDSGSCGLDLAEGIGIALQRGAVQESASPDLRCRLPWELRIKISGFQKIALRIRRVEVAFVAAFGNKPSKYCRGLAQVSNF